MWDLQDASLRSDALLADPRQLAAVGAPPLEGPTAVRASGAVVQQRFSRGPIEQVGGNGGRISHPSKRFRPHGLETTDGAPPPARRLVFAGRLSPVAPLIASAEFRFWGALVLQPQRRFHA